MTADKCTTVPATAEVLPSPSHANRMDAATGLPRKRFFRQRAHANVLGDHELE